MSAAAIVTFAADASTDPHPLAIPVLVAVMLIAAVVWFFTKPDDDKRVTTKAESEGEASPAQSASHSGTGDIDQRSYHLHGASAPVLKPRLEFSERHEYKRKPIEGARTKQFTENGWFFNLLVVNTGDAKATNVWATLAFTSQEDGVSLFPDYEFIGRWANNPSPDAAPQPVSANAPEFTRTEIPNNKQPEPLDVYVRFPIDGMSDDIYVWNNENLMLDGRGNNFRIEAAHNAFRLDVVVRGDDGVLLEGAWNIQALTYPRVDRIV